MKVIKRSLLLLLLFYILPVNGQVRLDLQLCRQMAAENSKKVALAEKQRMKATYEKRAYRANFFPKLYGTGMYAYMQKDQSFTIDGGYLPTFTPGADGSLSPNYLYNPATGQQVFAADGRPVFAQYAFMPDISLTLGLDNAYTVSGVLEQPLYMGGKIRSAFRMASIGEEIAEMNLKYNCVEIIAETDQAFWQYVRLNELEASAEKYKAVVDALIKNLEDAVQTGIASRNDLLKARVKGNEADLLLQKTRNGKIVSGMNLCRIVGLELDTKIEVKDTLGNDVTPGVLDVYPQIAGRPEYHMLDKEVELKKKQEHFVRSDFLPQLGVSASYGYTDGIAFNGKSEGMASFSAMASLKIPVFHWNEGRNKVKAAKAEREMSELKKEDVSEMMLLEATQARFNIEDAISRVHLTHNSLHQAEENLKESKDRYELGLEMLTNYLEAQAQWQSAYSDWIDAKAELRLYETYYLKATGRL